MNNKKNILKRRKKFIKYVKKNYSVYNANFIVYILCKYIDDLYLYHKEGLNVFCDKEQHKKVLASIEEAHHKVQNLRYAASSWAFDFSTLEIITEDLFSFVGKHYTEWWD